MILATTSQISGMRIVKTLGIARGNTIRARHLGKDILAALRNLAGGERREYTKLLAESREQSLARLVDEANDLGANAVVGIRFETCLIQSGASEMLCYGTAVQTEAC